MTLEEYARVIARKVLTAEFPYKSYAPGNAMAAQQERVLKEATVLVLGDLKVLLASYHVKFDEP